MNCLQCQNCVISVRDQYLRCKVGYWIGCTGEERIVILGVKETKALKINNRKMLHVENCPGYDDVNL